MQSAIFLSALPNYNNASAFRCSTSNCTWPLQDYTSLGVISKCADVSRQSVSLCNGNCTFITPKGVRLYPIPQKDDPEKDVDVTYIKNGTKFPLEPITVAARYGNDTDFHYNSTISPDLLTFAVSRNSAESYAEISECTLSWTGYLYQNISVTTNRLGIGNITVLPFENGGEVYIRSEEIGHIEFSVTPTSPLYNIPNFIVNADILSIVQSYLIPLFAESLPGATRMNMAQILYTGNISGIYNISWVAANITAAMTERIRTGPSSVEIMGTAWATDVFVHVRWGWLVLPILITVASLLFLIMSIALGKHCTTPLWKSSNTALLFHGLTPWDIEGHQVETVEEMDQADCKMKAQLLRNRVLGFQIM